MTAWKFGSYDLSSFGVVTLADDGLDIPSRRGNNQMIPFAHGTKFVEKFMGERTLLFGLTVVGENPDEIRGKLNTLKRLAAVRTQQTLYQYLTDGSILTAPASLDRAFQLKRSAPWVAELTLEFTLTQPFFRLSTVIADNTTTIAANPTAMTVRNPGTFEEMEPTIILTGPLQNTVITNSTNGYVLTYTGTIASPRVVTIQKDTTTKIWKATTDLGANVIGNITHSPSATLMQFEAETDNILSIADSTHTTGTVKITFNAPYL